MCSKKPLTLATLLEMDVKRPTRAFEELHQVAATRTERRQQGHWPHLCRLDSVTRPANFVPGGMRENLVREDLADGTQEAQS